MKIRPVRKEEIGDLMKIFDRINPNNSSHRAKIKNELEEMFDDILSNQDI